jgi:hypothetical protein
MEPDFLSALTIMIIPGTPLHEEVERGEFLPLSPIESLMELKEFVSHLSCPGETVFRTNHASNYLPLKGVLPRDKDRLIEVLEWAIENRALKPEWMRGL